MAAGLPIPRAARSTRHIDPLWTEVRPGIAFALLTRQLGEFASRGRAAAALDVDADNLTGALRLYRKAGLRPEPNFTIWARPMAR